MSALSHLAAHEIARDLGCLVSSSKLSPSASFVDSSAAAPGPLLRLIRWLHARMEQRYTMRQLNALPDYMLDDIGITRADIGRVAARASLRVDNGRLAA